MQVKQAHGPHLNLACLWRGLGPLPTPPPRLLLPPALLPLALLLPQPPPLLPLPPLLLPLPPLLLPLPLLRSRRFAPRVPFLEFFSAFRSSALRRSVSGLGLQAGRRATGQ